MLRLRLTRALSGSATRASAYVAAPRKTLAHIRSLYEQKTPISVATAWDYITGQAVSRADIDVALVGDSLAMVALGYEDTNELGMDEMLFHVRAVARGNTASLIVADMPFGSFEASDAEAVALAVRLVKHGRAQAVKIEGGTEVVLAVERIVRAGVPVMGHVGLTPQKHHALGGYKLQGASAALAARIVDDCRALQAAGVFAVVLECVPNKLAEVVTAALAVPTIGIGAGPGCSGQVLVTADMLNMGERAPAKFVQTYMDFAADATAALRQYKRDVVERTFPDPDRHGYKMKADVLREVRLYVEKR